MTTSPTYGPIRSAWGPRKALIPGMSTFHRGVDIGAGAGAPLVAPAAGQVIASTYNAIRGHYVVVDHGDGWSTEHQHLSRRYAVVGDDVGEGELIGLVGRAGAVTGAHLHTEVRQDGTPVDPTPWYLARGVILGTAIRVAGNRITNENGDTMLGIVVVAEERGHMLMAPGYAHTMNGEEWPVVAETMRSSGAVAVVDLTGDADGGQRRFDLLHAALTHPDASW